MKKKSSPRPQPVPEAVPQQRFCETALSLLMLVTAAFHLFILFFQYTLSTLSAATLLADRWLCVALAVLGILYGIFSRLRFKNTAPRLREFFRTACGKDQFLLLFLLVWSVISCLYMSSEQHSDFLSKNAVLILDSVVSVLILYPLGTVFRNRPRCLYGLLHLVMVFSTAFMVYVMVGLFRSSILILADSQVVMNSSGAAAVVCHRNTLGAYGSLLFMVSLFLIFSHKAWAVRVPYVCAAIVHLIVTDLSNSRTACYSVLIVCMLMGFFILYKGSKAVRWKRVLFGILCAAAVGIILYASREGIYRVYEAVTRAAESAAASAAGSEVSAGAAVSAADAAGTAASGEDGVRTGLDLNGREGLYASFLPAMFQSVQRFFFGVTTVAVQAQITSVGIIDASGLSYMHNEYMQIGVAFGFPALLAYTLWSLIMLKKCVLHLNTARGAALAGIVLMLIVSNLFESYLFAYAYFGGSMFFLFCGMLRADDTGAQKLRELFA